MANAGIVVGVGARNGVGGAVCRRLAREGLVVYAAGRTREKLDLVCEEIEAQGGTARPVVTDTTVESQVEALFDTAGQAGDDVELAVYNAGNNHPGDLLTMETEYFEQTWRVCCLGGFLVGRSAARAMLPRGGTLVFTGATASVKARPPFLAFASAKWGLRALAQGMAREFGPQGLHVAHAIIDGGIDGEVLNSRFPEFKERVGAEGLLSPDAIADAYWTLHRQHRSAWTFEIDLRPFKETF